MSLLTRAKAASQLGRILYITDKFGVSQGYEPAFTKMVHKAGIPRSKILLASAYAQIEPLLKKYRNEKTLRFNPEKKPQITAWVDQRIKQTRPSVIVCSDPACLGLFTGWDIGSSTIDKCRGGKYEYQGIPVIVTLPITAIHRNVDERVTRTLKQQGDEDEDVAGGQVYQPYRVQSGAWILSQDWGKVARYLHGKERRLPPFQYSVCRTLDDCRAAERWLAECSLISVDIETACWPSQITCSGYTGLRPDGRVRSFVIPFYDERKPDGCFWEDEDDHVEAFLCMRRINESPVLKVLQNGNYDASYFVRDNAGLEGFLLDTMLMWYSMFMELPKTLDFISSILIDSYQYWKDDIKGADNKDEVNSFGLEKYWRYNALDTYYTLFNCLYLLRAFQGNAAIQWNYRDVFMRSRSAFFMSMRGIKADFNKLREHREALAAEAKEAVARFRYIIADPAFNINSPDQKQAFLYDVLGATPRNAKGRVCKANEKPSSGAIAIKQIKNDHPLFKYILTALEAAMVPDKQMGNITGRLVDGQVKGGIKFLTNRLRTSYNAAGTETTRFSSKGSAFWDGTNLQNIRDKYRDFAVADPGHILIDVDYSQSDDFFMGYESEDAHKIEVLGSGKDGHCLHGELFFKRSYDELVAGKNEWQPDGNKGAPWVVHPIYGIRQLSKKIVHAANFNMSPPTLYLVLMGKDATIAAMKYLGHHDADKWNQTQLITGGGYLLDAYRREYPRLTDRGYFRELKEKLLLDAQLTNCFGITRRFMGDPKDSGTIREAAAFMGQSGTAGNMNRVMYEIDHGWIPPTFRDGPNPDAGDEPRKMDLVSHGFRFLLQTHDSFTVQLSLDHPRLHEAVNNLLYVMDRPVLIHGREVRVRTEASLGLRWGKGMLSYEHGKDDLDEVIARALKETW